MEVADDRHADAHLGEALFDAGDRGRRLVAVDGDAHDLGTCARQRRDLSRRLLDVGGIGVGHGLHDDGRVAADDDAADVDGHRPAALLRSGFDHVGLLCRRQVPDGAGCVNAHGAVLRIMPRGSGCRCR